MSEESLSQEEEDRLYYGIIPGPAYNNHNVCDSDEYVCTFSYTYMGPPDNRGPFTAVMDLYVLSPLSDRQSVLIRESGENPWDYQSCPMSSFYEIAKYEPFKTALAILLTKGYFTWTRKSLG